MDDGADGILRGRQNVRDGLSPNGLKWKGHCGKNAKYWRKVRDNSGLDNSGAFYVCSNMDGLGQ